MYVFNVFGVFIWCRKHVGSRFPGISARSKGGQSQEVPIVLSEENERRRGMQVLEQKIQMCIVDSNKKIRSTSFEKDWNHCVHCAKTGGDFGAARKDCLVEHGETISKIAEMKVLVWQYAKEVLDQEDGT